MAAGDAIWHTGELLAGQNVIDRRATQGYDIHVLRGTTSLPLRSILLIEDLAGGLFRADAAQLPAGISAVTFVGEFAAPGRGASVNAATGEVTATSPPPPAPRLRSFHVTPQVGLTAGGTILGPPIRVRIHESVAEIWLTPSTLTVRGNAQGQRFTVLARFDDDTVGDITRLASAPTAAGQPLVSGFTWTSSDNTCSRIDDQGRLDGTFSLTACTSTITAALRQPGWPTLSATAQVTVIEPWGELRSTSRELHVLSGPGPAAVADVPNILILSDGFLDTPDDQADFDSLAFLLVNRLNTNASTAPFNLLRQTINYWTLFVPSRERGTSTLDDLVEFATLFDGPPPAGTPVMTLSVAGQHNAGDTQIDFAHPTLAGGLPTGVHFTIAGDLTLYVTTNSVNAQGNALHGVGFTPALVRAATNGAAVQVIGRWVTAPRGIPAGPQGAGAPPLDFVAMYENLVGVVGLPVPAERSAHASTAAELAAKVADWTTLYGPRIQPALITNVVYDFWARWLPDHRLADEKDTAFGLATGERPRAQVLQGEQALTWHPLRTSRTDVDQLLATLTFQGTVIGQTWAAPAAGQPAKDRNLVFVLSRGARFSGTNARGDQPIVAMGLVDDTNVRVQHGSGRSIQLVSHPLQGLTNFVHSTMAHEAAHSFGLLDEYGGNALLLSGTADERHTLQSGNVTPMSEIAVVPAPIGGAPVDPRITGDKLRWRWPRILKAGVLAGQPTPEPGAAGVFLLKLRPGHQTRPGGDVFLPNDTVFLRQRPLLGAPAAVQQPALNPASQSVALAVIAPDPARQLAPDELLVQVTGGAAFVPADFGGVGPAAPVLFAPVPAAASAAAAGDHYAELVPQFIRAHINSSHGALNRMPASLARACTPPQGNGFMEPQAANNLPPAGNFPGGRLPAITSRIVGAYEGGNAFSCGIYHPAGSCIMRTPMATKTEQHITNDPPSTVHPFCPVCRYLVVDWVDPRQHGAIDALYTVYPQP